MTVTVTDLFCGAGGSSSGAEQIPGVRVRMAANHWKLAVDTHNTNLPHADHDVAEISAVDPRRYPHTDILWASPECTNHSQARGRKRDLGPDLFGDTLPDEAAERSRATMWDVPRFAEHHRYRAIVVENVVDAARWVMWPAWLHAMDLLGYDHRIIYLNSMHAQAMGAPAPQSRDRVYVVFWRRGERRPDIDRWTRPAAWCGTCEQIVPAVQSWKRATDRWGRYRTQYVWRCPNVACRNQKVEPGWLPAAAAIDWALPGERIGDRARPLADKTRARIEAGLRKYARPIHLDAHPDRPQRNRCGRPAVPDRAPPHEYRTAGLDQPTPTITAGGHHLGLVVPLRNNNTAKPTSDPLDTVAANGNHHALVMRNNTGGAEMLTPVDEPLRALTTKGHQSLVHWAALYGYDTGQLRSPDDVLPTQTTVEGDALLTAAEVPDVDDCYFRMLEPHEIQAGMAFLTDYIVLGNKRERVRQLGNAVTPPAARDLIAAVVEAITGEEVEPA